MLGIRDDLVHERLLRSNDLTLEQAIGQVKSSEQTQQQVNDMTEGNSLVHAIQKSGLSDHAEDEGNPRLPPNKTRNVGIVECPMDVIVLRMGKHVSQV